MYNLDAADEEMKTNCDNIFIKAGLPGNQLESFKLTRHCQVDGMSFK